MKSAAKYISFVFLGAGLCVPAAIVARAASQDEHRQEENRRDAARLRSGAQGLSQLG
jgi:hypothetical protein